MNVSTNVGETKNPANAGLIIVMGSQNKNLGDITVNSIKILDDGTGAFIRIYNTEDELTVRLGCSPGRNGGGYLKTYSYSGKSTGYFGTSEELEGKIYLCDSYGKVFWYRDN